MRGVQSLDGERSPGGGHGNPLWCSCLENSTDIGAWQATVHMVAKRQTQLNWLSTHACTQSLREHRQGNKKPLKTKKFPKCYQMSLHFLENPKVAMIFSIEMGFLPGLIGMDHGNSCTIFLWAGLAAAHLLKFLPVSPANPRSLKGAQFLCYCAAGISSLLNRKLLASPGLDDTAIRGAPGSSSLSIWVSVSLPHTGSPSMKISLPTCFHGPVTEPGAW